MNERIMELKQKMDHLDELIEERDEAYNEYMKDVEANKNEFINETLYEMSMQIINDIRSKDEACEFSGIDDRIDDIFEGKCQQLESYTKYIRLNRDIALIRNMKQMKGV